MDQLPYTGHEEHARSLRDIANQGVLKLHLRDNLVTYGPDTLSVVGLLRLALCWRVFVMPHFMGFLLLFFFTKRGSPRAAAAHAKAHLNVRLPHEVNFRFGGDIDHRPIIPNSASVRLSNHA